MMKPKWQSLCAGFLEWFMQYEVDPLCSSMIASVRTLASLGKSPQTYTTNGNESLNNLLKRKVNFKRHEWPCFIEVLYESVKSNNQSLRRQFLAKVNIKCFLRTRVSKFHI